MNSEQLYIISGHSLSDSGAVANNRQENKETIEFKRLLLEAIKQQNPDVKVLVDDDSDNLTTVISKAKGQVNNKTILLDVHFNSASPSAKGTETLVKVNATEAEHRLADRINKITSTILDTPNRGVKLETYTRHKRLGILHTGAKISVLWEVEFISNKASMKQVDKWKHWLCWEVASILIEELEKL